MAQAAKRAGRKAFTRDELLKELFHWFKDDFFSWPTIICQKCKGATTFDSNKCPNEEELKVNTLSTEIHVCNSASCRATTRFPRYRHYGKLLVSRTGRCGEWAQTFTFCCRALGFQARIVHGSTYDHVWTEVYSDTLKKFINCDPGRALFDDPLKYENDGNELLYIFACSAHGNRVPLDPFTAFNLSCSEMRDVTRRYTKDYASVLRRRTRCSEQWLELLLLKINGGLTASLSDDERRRVQERWQRENQQLHDIPTASNGASTSASAAARNSASSSSSVLKAFKRNIFQRHQVA